MTDRKLLPCPFCGGIAILSEDPYDDNCQIACKSCGFMSDYNRYCEKEDLVDQWNTRVAPTLQWTKELPTENDCGKLFLLKMYGRSCEIVEIYKKNKQLFFGRMPLSFYLAPDIHPHLEFLGPLPE